jgi:hypothetical protein
VSPVSEFGQCVEIKMKGVTAILALRAIKGVCGQPWHMLGTLETQCPCLGSARRAPNSLVLARVRIDCK